MVKLRRSHWRGYKIFVARIKERRLNIQTLNEKTLNLLEDRFVQGCMGDIEISASVLEILRRILHDNARLTVAGNPPGDPSGILEAADDDMPDYGGAVVNFR